MEHVLTMANLKLKPFPFTPLPNSHYILMNVLLGSPSAYLDIQLEIKLGTKKIVRNKAIPSRVREPAALLIYAPLRRFLF